MGIPRLPILRSERLEKSELRQLRVKVLQVLQASDMKPLIDDECPQDMLALRPPDLDVLYPMLVPSADGSITAADVEKRRQLRAVQEHKNEQLSAQFGRLLDKKKAILAQMLADSLEKNAAGQLEIMREANPLTKTLVTGGGATVTTRVDEMFDGVGMMKDFLHWLNRDIYDDESDFHLECLVQMRAHPLPADCTESQLTGRVAQVTANLNPYLGTHALKGLELSRFIINSLPKSLSQTQLALLRRLKTDPASCANYTRTSSLSVARRSG